MCSCVRLETGEVNIMDIETELEMRFAAACFHAMRDEAAADIVMMAWTDLNAFGQALGIPDKVIGTITDRWAEWDEADAAGGVLWPVPAAFPDNVVAMRRLASA